MDRQGLVQLLVGRESEAIQRTLALMAFNPAIGRVLERSSVLRFADLAVESIPRLYGEVTRQSFDEWHTGVCRRLVDEFRTASGETLAYGQAQKPLNVFMKVYVDFARKPTPELADRLAPFLHVPLDSVIMKFVKREFRDDYETRIAVRRKERLQRLTERARKMTKVSASTVARHFL